MTEPQVYYRVEERIYSSGCDEFGDPYPRTPGFNVALRMCKFPVLSTTKHGVWIDGPRGKRFINNSWTKRYAVPTIEEAWESFIARKRREIRLYAARLLDAKAALALGEAKRLNTCSTGVLT